MADENLICAYSGLPSLASYMLEQEKRERVVHKSNKSALSEIDKDRIIQMAWEDRTPFEAIEFQFGLKEKDVVEFMRNNSLPSSFRMWRKRMKSRKTKHASLRNAGIIRFKCTRQKGSGNKISKR